jgi:hypothetical protein
MAITTPHLKTQIIDAASSKVCHRRFDAASEQANWLTT